MEKRLEFYSNEDVVAACRWTAEDGTPYDVSSAQFSVKKRATDVAVLAEVHLGTGLTKEPGTFWLTSRIMAGVIPPGLYRYDFHVVRALDSYSVNLLDGELEIKSGITPVA